jgi:hypothetical protein
MVFIHSMGKESIDRLKTLWLVSFDLCFETVVGDGDKLETCRVYNSPASPANAGVDADNAHKHYYTAWGLRWKIFLQKSVKNHAV